MLKHHFKGSLNAVTPHRRFLITVRSEPDGWFAEPTHAPRFIADLEMPS